MSIITFGLGPGGSFEDNAVRFSDMKNAKLKVISLDAGLQIPVYSAKVEKRVISAGIKTVTLSAKLVTEEPSGSLKC